MPDERRYKTGTAFRAALEERLKAQAKALGRSLTALRKIVCFERLSARLFSPQSTVRWAIKGGYRLELGLQKTRTTKDLDLVLIDEKLLSADEKEQAQSILGLLQEAARLDLDDFFTFDISFKETIKHATVGGARYLVRASIEGRQFDDFRLDVVIAETQMARNIPMPSQDWLAFAGIAGPTIYAINEEMQFAEKLHAYTYPWELSENSRVKDMLDMVILSKRLQPDETVRCIKEIFKVRQKQTIPKVLPSPHSDWEPMYRVHAEEYGYTGSMPECFAELEAFYKTLETDLITSGPIAAEVREEKNSMTSKTAQEFDVELMLEYLVKTNAFPQMAGKSLTECIAIAVKESQTSNTAVSNQWRALLQALLAGAIVNKLDKIAEN